MEPYGTIDTSEMARRIYDPRHPHPPHGGFLHGHLKSGFTKYYPGEKGKFYAEGDKYWKKHKRKNIEKIAKKSDGGGMGLWLKSKKTGKYERLHSFGATPGRNLN